MRSGKSTLFAILDKLSFQSISASSISPSVIYRIIDKFKPTMLCDEADTYLTEKHEDLRCIFNAGHSRDTAKVLRTNPDTLEPEVFNSFGAKAIAAIKGIPGTIEDRSIIIKMRRKPKNIKKDKLRLTDESHRNIFHNIKQKCIRFSQDNINQLKENKPVVPNELHDRAADNWYPLLQIAALAGNEWVIFAEHAALHLSGIENENKSLGVELLEDIRNLFDGKYQHAEAIPTADLIESLCLDDESPWATYNLKKQDTKILPRQLAKLLSPYGIKSINNIGTHKKKGYRKADFENAFVYASDDMPDFSATNAPSAQSSNKGDSGTKEKMSSSATNAPSATNFDNLTEEAHQSTSERQSDIINKPLEPASNKDVADGAEIAGIFKSSQYINQDYIEI